MLFFSILQLLLPNNADIAAKYTQHRKYNNNGFQHTGHVSGCLRHITS